MEHLQKHTLFNDRQRQAHLSKSESGLCNLISFSPLKDELFVFDPQHNRINVINIHTINSAHEKNTQVLHNHPPKTAPPPFFGIKIICKGDTV